MVTESILFCWGECYFSTTRRYTASMLNSLIVNNVSSIHVHWQCLGQLVNWPARSKKSMDGVQICYIN